MTNLLLMGSPRKNGNSASIIEWFAKKLTDYETLSIYELKINPCNGCEACKEMRNCVLKDSMGEVYKKIREAKQIIIAVPIYFLGFPSEFKALIDRTQVFWHHPLPRDKKALIFMTGERANSSLKEYYDKIWKYTLANWGVQEIRLEVMGNIFRKEEIQEKLLKEGLEWLKAKQ